MMLYIALFLYTPYILFLFYNRSPYEIYKSLENNIYGKDVFNYIISFVSPYSGSICPSVELFDKTECRCSIIERRCLKNPFNSVHALALANLGEFTSGLLMMEYLQSLKKRGIITKITAEYHKKARGKITAICNLSEFKNGQIKSDLINEKGDIVCEIKCQWLIKDIN
jgi:hypothetical protein